MDANEESLGNLRPMVETLPPKVRSLLHSRDGLGDLTVAYIQHCVLHLKRPCKNQLAYWRRCHQFLKQNPQPQAKDAPMESLNQYFQMLVS